MSSAPAMFNPINPQPGDFHLELACAPLQGSWSGPTCVRYA
jgi:hypothetical protein